MSSESEITTIPRARAVYYTAYANLPTAGLAIGDLGYATDRLVLYRWNGAVWQRLSIHSSSGAAGAIPTAANLPNGSLYFETDTLLLKQVQAGSWVIISNVAYTQGARVYHDATQVIPNTTWTYLAFNQERRDTDTIHDLSTNNSRLTCKTAGVYVMTGNIYFGADVDGIRNIEIRKDGSTPITRVSENTISSEVDYMTCNTIHEMAVNEYIELGVYQACGGDLNLYSSAENSPEFSMQRIGQ